METLYSTRIDKVSIQAFRAYLKPQEFTLLSNGKPLNLVVYAPNSKGKSSLVDAFEFYFSRDATLDRLGKNEAQRNAGRTALAHIDAEKADLLPEVHFWFRQGSDKFDEKRAVSSKSSPLTAPAARIIESTRVPFVVRGYELRFFAETQTPEERYEEVSRWFGLAPLVDIQKNLRSLRRLVKQRADSNVEKNERLRDLARVTKEVHPSWDEGKISRWANAILLAPLDSTLQLKEVSKKDLTYKTIEQRAKDEEGKISLPVLESINTAAVNLYQKTDPETEGGQFSETGAIIEWRDAIQMYGEALVKEKDEKAKASEALFSAVWGEAKDVFENLEVPLSDCPVCTTPIENTVLKTREHIKSHLETKILGLKTYNQANMALTSTETILTQKHIALRHALSRLSETTKDTEFVKDIVEVESFSVAIDSWKKGDAYLNDIPVVAALVKITTDAEGLISGIKSKQGDNTYKKSLQVVNELMQIKSDLRRIDATKAELNSLLTSLNGQASFINRQIAEHIQSQIDRLQARINDLYKKIQSDSTAAPRIQLVLPPEDDTNQQRLSLLFNFADNRTKVIPGGYLSDSQLHTLGLCLRLAAIEIFNPDFPVVVLDDVVTSYDIDHRKDLASVLATQFTNHQLIIATHDEMFFKVLQDHLPSESSKFTRIIKIEPDFGPKFQNYKTTDETILGILDNGESAANEMRAAEEEWLYSIARGFKVSVPMRSVERPYEFSRAELAAALATFLKSRNITPPSVPGISNVFLQSLQAGVVENFGSHFSDNPNLSGSLGDELSRWKEFVWFRDQFVCPECKKAVFIRPDSIDRPLCKSCNTPFTFSVPEIVGEIVEVDSEN